MSCRINTKFGFELLASCWKLAIITLIFTLLCCGLVGCSSPDQEVAPPLEKESFEGWQLYKYGNIRILHPPNHPYQDQFESIATGYLKALADITKLLERPFPDDTLTIVYYLDSKTAMTITEQNYPFVSEGIIHFWQPSFYGVTLMHWYLPHWVEIETRHKFIAHGLMTLFDHSGQNYHAETLRFIDEGRFIPLSALVIDERINSNIERYQSTEAASFCAFVLAWYGAEVLESMYRFEGSFEEYVQGALSLDVDSLEAIWLEVIVANRETDSLETTTP